MKIQKILWKIKNVNDENLQMIATKQKNIEI